MTASGHELGFRSHPILQQHYITPLSPWWDIGSTLTEREECQILSHRLHLQKNSNVPWRSLIQVSMQPSPFSTTWYGWSWTIPLSLRYAVDLNCFIKQAYRKDLFSDTQCSDRLTSVMNICMFRKGRIPKVRTTWLISITIYHSSAQRCQSWLEPRCAQEGEFCPWSPSQQEHNSMLGNMIDILSMTKHHALQFKPIQIWQLKITVKADHNSRPVPV